jgi:DeoR family transcriptional regulator, aga operon transcriptional repressor
MIGPGAMQSLGDLFMDRLFLSVSGIDAQRGATTNEADEALTFRTMVRQAKQVVIVADSSKLGVVTASLICPIESVHVLVTDSNAPNEAIAPFEDRGIKVIQV